MSAAATISAACRLAWRSRVATCSRAAAGSARVSGSSAQGQRLVRPALGKALQRQWLAQREFRQVGAVAAQRLQQRPALGRGGEGPGGGVALGEALDEPGRALGIMGTGQAVRGDSGRGRPGRVGHVRRGKR